MNKSSSIYQSAIRLLYVLVNGAEEYNDDYDTNIKAIFRGKSRLYAMDFWIRYPDYFANELLEKFKETNDSRYLEAAESIFENNEPDLRRVPMIRYLFGAYEDLNNTLSILISKGLIKQTGQKSGTTIHQHDFLIFDKAFELTQRAIVDFSILEWYDERARLINEIAGDKGGTALKNRQYEQIVYAKTKLGGIIPSIKDDVLNKIESLKILIK